VLLAWMAGFEPTAFCSQSNEGSPPKWNLSLKDLAGRHSKDYRLVEVLAVPNRRHVTQGDSIR